jgi:hypothetical protein
LEDVCQIPKESILVMGKGDDSVIAYPKSYEGAVEKARKEIFAPRQDFLVHGLGLICKFSRKGDVDDVDFISNLVFINGEGGLRMSRIPARVFQTLSWSTKIPNNVDVQTRTEIAKQLCWSKGMCMRAWAKGLPIFEVLAEKLIQLGKEGKWSHREYNQYSDGIRVWGDHDDREAFAGFLEAKFGLSKQDIHDIEEVIVNISDIFEVVDLPQLSAFYQ